MSCSVSIGCQNPQTCFAGPPEELVALLKEKKFKLAAIALANRTARVVWVLLVRGGTYIANHQPKTQAARA